MPVGWFGTHTHWVPDQNSGWDDSRLTACSIYVSASGQKVTANPEAVTCGNCRRTRAYRDALGSA